MNKQIKRLAWKYFWQQKKKEVVDFFEDVVLFFEEAWVAFAIMMIIVGSFCQMGWIINVETGLPECKALAIIGLCMIGLWILIGLIALVKVVYKWLRSNWVEALERAKGETIKKTKQKGGKKN